MDDRFATALPESSFESALVNFSTERFLGRLLYLLLSLPLGIFYFTFLAVGISLGLGLAVIWIGIPILVVLLAAWRLLMSFETRLAGLLLGARIGRSRSSSAAQRGVWETLKFYIRDSATWKGLVFLMLKLPLGIASFVVTVSLVAASLSLIAVPLVYEVVEIDFVFGIVTTMEQALLCAFAGVMLAIVSIVSVNGMAFFWSRLAAGMLTSAPMPICEGAQANQAPVMIP